LGLQQAREGRAWYAPTWRCLRNLALALFALALVHALIGEISVVPTPSMEGTILVGDHLLLNKALYGPEIPLLGIRLPRLKTIRRGDIITFRYPRKPELLFIKRVVAVGGDQVELRAGVLYVNSRSVREPYARDRSREFMPPRTVREGELFVLGDNRDNSDDSRQWGTVPVANVVGEPLMIFWSYNAPTAAWLDRNGNLRPGVYASAMWNLFSHTRWARTGILL
jgi:signal peptidase I